MTSRAGDDVRATPNSLETPGRNADGAPSRLYAASAASRSRRRGTSYPWSRQSEPGRVLGERVAVALAVRGPHERRDDLEVPLGDVGRLAPEVGQPEVDVELEQVDPCGLGHGARVRDPSDGHAVSGTGMPPGAGGHRDVRRARGTSRTVACMGRIRVGPHASRRESPGGGGRAPARARLRRVRDRLRVRLLDGLPVGGAARRARAGARRRALRPCAALRLGRPPRDERAASGRPRSARSTAAPGSRRRAAPRSSSSIPGFLLGRSREDAIDAVVEQLALVRERLEGKDRAVPFGIEVMGRVRDLGSLEDCVEISRRAGWVRPVIDFAHMHATSDGAFLEAEPFPRRSSSPTACSSRGRRSTSTSPTSPTRTATRRSTSPTARARCAPSRCARRSAASSGPRR